MNQICEINECTGCCSCYNICPKKSIIMKEDMYGVLRPIIDESKCSDCGLCKKACPVNNDVRFYSPLKVYAAWSLNEDVRKKSASGGIAYEMYQFIIRQEGIAVGTEFDSQMNLFHKATSNLKEIEKFRGSKYVQSFIGNVFKEIKQYLKQDRRVIFIGTPCQVAGLNQFLGNKENHNLVTVDLVCHGVPPQKYLKEYLKYLNIKEEVNNVTFRGENDRFFTALLEKNIIYKKDSKEDLYYKSFLDGIIDRENCYHCKYARKERVADITIGDFWGIGKEIPFKYDTKNGVSLFIVNTEKGMQLMQDISPHIFLKERSLEEAIKGNMQLSHPIIINYKTNIFRELYEKYGFEVALQRMLEEV